jgi:hypothetical protein
MRFAMTPAQIQLSYAVERMIQQWAARFSKLSDKEIEVAIKRVNRATDFFATSRKRDDAA